VINPRAPSDDSLAAFADCPRKTDSRIKVVPVFPRRTENCVRPAENRTQILRLVQVVVDNVAVIRPRDAVAETELRPNLPCVLNVEPVGVTTPAILNTGNSFDLKTIEGGHMPIEGFHGFKNKDIEKVSYRSPEFYLRA
jgi:hypothetical protein